LLPFRNQEARGSIPRSSTKIKYLEKFSPPDF